MDYAKILTRLSQEPPGKFSKWKQGFIRDLLEKDIEDFSEAQQDKVIEINRRIRRG